MKTQQRDTANPGKLDATGLSLHVSVNKRLATQRVSHGAHGNMPYSKLGVLLLFLGVLNSSTL